MSALAEKFVVEKFLEDVKKRSLAPISQKTFSDEAILEIASSEMRLKLAASIMERREDFFSLDTTVPIVAGKNYYSIPERATANAIKSIRFKFSDGTYRDIDRVDETRRSYYGGLSGIPAKFYFQGDEVVLLPMPDAEAATGEIEFSYPCAPSFLTLTENCAKITNVSSAGGTTTFTVDTDLTESLDVGDIVDFLSHKSPFKLWAVDSVITAITSTTIAVATADVVDPNDSVEPVVNDYICPAGLSNIPQIPSVYHAILAQMVVIVLMEALGDANKRMTAKDTLKEMFIAAGLMIANRAESQPQKWVPRRNVARSFR